jgi:HlyD family secretion protein
MSKKKLLLLLSLFVVIAGMVVVALVLRGNGPEGITVQVEPVGRIEIVQTVTGTGRIQPKTQVNISADVSAKITRLDVEEGDWVEKGTFLVELDRERYLAALESAEANLRVAQAGADVARENMNKAEKDYSRVRELHDAGLETPARLDSAQALFEAEKARRQAALDQVEQVRAELKRSRDDLSKTRIYAPMTGTISQLNKEVGEIALGSQFQEDVILVISNLEGMEAQVQVDENDIVSISVGDAATIEVDALPDFPLDGTVTEIANTASISGSGTTDQKTEFEVKITITGPVSELRPGMTATADVVTEVREQALGVPIQAVAVRTLEQLRSGPGEDGGGSDWQPDKDGFIELVFVVAGGVAEARQVRTGIQSETHIEIVEGLEEGEEIVVGSYRAISRDLRDGSSVVVGDEPDAGGPGPS